MSDITTVNYANIFYCAIILAMSTENKIEEEEKFENPYKAPKGLLEGKKGVIMGVANKDSIAWHIAMLAKAHGAELCITYQEALEKRAGPLAEELGVHHLVCEVTDDNSIEQCFEKIKTFMPEIDFLIYGPAFANKDELKGKFLDMNRDNFAQALDISCYSMIPCVKKAKESMREGASVLALTYYGSEKVIPCYDLMGVAKAALEATVRYLAYYLGGEGIRANAVSAGPVRTMAASRGIKGYNCLEEYYTLNSPMQTNITVTEAAQASVYMVSDFASGTTGEIHYVDKGYNIMGVKNPNTGDVDLSTYRNG